jgi:asparagine synthase (glutamine-hydrolysing)
VSGIVGFLALDGRPVQSSDVERMNASIVHRGPDGSDAWVEGPIGLGHCMLHTTPESLEERLPLARDGLAITADARLDNREDLFSALGVEPGARKDIPDSALILLAYQRWGEDCAGRLLGDFCFAIWDSRARRLVCARDHFGVKPLYYYYEPGRRFVFGSEIKAIFCVDGIEKRLNEVKIADYMLEMLEDTERTFYEGIQRLSPASVLSVDQDGMRRTTYWALDPEREIRLGSDAEYAEAFRDLLTEAVRCRLHSAFPVGTMLSGGLDSSSIACLAHDLQADAGGPALHTFSIVFDEIEKSDEREYIRHVLSGRHFDAHFILGDHATPFDGLEAMLSLQDEPYPAPNVHLNRLAWESAQQHGVRVLLDGFLGDNVVSHGVEHLIELANRWRWRALATELRQYLQRSGGGVPPLRAVMQHYFVEHALKPRTPDLLLRLWRRLRGYPIDPHADELALFQRSFSDRVGLKRRLEERYRRSRANKNARQAHYESLVGGMVQTALEVYNKGCGGLGIEARIPFIDKRLVEFCLATPGVQKINGGYTRMIMRNAMTGILPEEIRCRSSKGDLGHAFIRGLGLATRGTLDGLYDTEAAFLERFFAKAKLDWLKTIATRRGARDEHVLWFFLVTLLAAWSRRDPCGQTPILAGGETLDLALT